MCIHAALPASGASVLRLNECDWQDKEEVDGRYSKQKMVLGTHTSEGEQNYLMLAEVRQLPASLA
jgi:Histone-binding protein RBBP4 or subunit C of CAF1 complex